MQYGAAIFPTESSIRPADLALALEERGFESLWVCEHSHIPASRATPFPGGGELPRMYYETYDPFVALAAAAAVTTRLKLATGICLVVQRDPIHTAKQVASLDRISDGRFLFGVGGGWNAEEMADHGTPFDRRWKILRERIEAMKRIWSEEQAEYHGEFVDFEPMYAWPKPVQQPHPPIHVAGAFPGGARRALRYGDGWIPIFGMGKPESHVEEVRKLAAEAGRSLEISFFGVPGKADPVRSLRDAGADRAVIMLPPQGRDETLARLDHCAELVAALG